MRGKALFALFLMGCICMTGCGADRNGVSSGSSSSAAVNEEVDTGEESVPEHYVSFGEMGSDAFVRKLKGMEISDNTLTIGIDAAYNEEALEQVNQLLKKEGFSFDVCFVSIPQQSILDEAAVDFFQLLKEEGISMDVLPVWKQDLPELAQYGLITDLSEEVQKDAELRAAFPEGFWELTSVNGKNYGTGTCYAEPAGWAVNTDLMETYGFTSEELSVDMTGLEPVFETVTEKESDPGFSAFIYEPRFFLEKIPFSFIDPTLPIGCWTDAEDGAEVVNLFDTPEMEKLAETLNDYYQKGYVQVESDLISGGSFLMQADVNDFPVHRSDALDTWTNQTGIRLCRIPWFRQTRDRLTYEINTIPSWSEKKEEAWDFLRFINENEKASELLLYGVEGQDYSIDEDHANAGENLSEEDIYGRSLGNQYLAMPIAPYEDSMKRELMQDELDSLEESRYGDFVFDSEPVQKEVDAVRELYMELSVFREMFAFQKTEEYAVWQDYYNAYNDQLKEAGIDRIIDEMNHQIQEYRKNVP